MKKYIGYLIIIVIGVVSIAGMMFRTESLDNKTAIDVIEKNEIKIS